MDSCGLFPSLVVAPPVLFEVAPSLLKTVLGSLFGSPFLGPILADSSAVYSSKTSCTVINTKDIQSWLLPMDSESLARNYLLYAEPFSLDLGCNLSIYLI